MTIKETRIPAYFVRKAKSFVTNATFVAGAIFPCYIYDRIVSISIAMRMPGIMPTSARVLIIRVLFIRFASVWHKMDWIWIFSFFREWVLRGLPC